MASISDLFTDKPDITQNFGTAKTYTLMNKDLPLVSFCLTDMGRELFTVTDVKEINQSPYGSEKLSELLESRKPARNRTYLEELLQKMQINSISGYLDISYGLSLNDTLWFKPSDAPDILNWSKLNLYTNEFNEMIAHFAFCGQGLAGMNMKTTSPEFGTNGMLPKCWHREEDGIIYLYKGGTFGCSNTGNEPYSEYMCSAILAAMGMSDFVPYTLKRYHGSLVSSCPIFTSEQTGFVPVCNYSNPTRFLQIVDLFTSLGLRKSFDDLMVFDALVFNTDRHLNNYGFLVDNDTYKVEGMAPVFDNGCGMLPFYTMDKDIDEYAKKYDYQNSGLCNDDILNICLKERHKKMLSNLVDFRFPPHPLFDLPPERVERLEALLQRRLRYILARLQ